MPLIPKRYVLLPTTTTTYMQGILAHSLAHGQFRMAFAMHTKCDAMKEKYMGHVRALCECNEQCRVEDPDSGTPAVAFNTTWGATNPW